MHQLARAALGIFLLAPGAAMAQTAATPAAVPAAGQAPGGRGPALPPLPVQIVRVDPALDKLIAPGAQLTVLASGFGGNEGPMWKDGKLWVSEQRNNQITAVDKDGTKTVVVPNAGGPFDTSARFNQGPNGLVPYKDGAVLVCRQGSRDIGILSKDGTMSSFISTYQGKHINAPNDLVVAPDGAVWFTDPSFSVPGGRGLDNPNRQLPWTAVFRWKDGVLTPEITDIDMPNGIGFSPDGKTLYVSNDGPNVDVWAYDVAADGSVSHGRQFFHWDTDPTGRPNLPDGLKIDSQGNVWATGTGGVNIITPQGKLLGRLQVATRGSNVAFGGPDYKTVYITGGDVVYQVHTLVAGEKPMYAEK